MSLQIGQARRLTKPRWGVAALVGAVVALVLTACDPLANDDLSSRDVDAGDAASALEQQHINLPDGYTYRAGRKIPVAFAGSPGYDLHYEAPAELFADPRALEAAYTGTSFNGAFSAFRPLACDADILRIARGQGWVTCTPQTRAKFSVTGAEPANTRRPFYYDGIVLVEGEGQTQVIVVIGGT